MRHLVGDSVSKWVIVSDLRDSYRIYQASELVDKASLSVISSHLPRAKALGIAHHHQHLQPHLDNNDQCDDEQAGCKRCKI